MGNLADLNLDLDSIPESTGFDLLPNGVYEAIVAKSEKKTSEKGYQYISIEFQIIGENGKGRKLWERLNLWHPNAKSSLIGQQLLKNLYRVTNIRTTPVDTAELHDIPFLMTIEVKNKKDSEELENRITKYEAKTGAVRRPKAPAPVTTPAQIQAPSALAPADDDEMPF